MSYKKINLDRDKIDACRELAKRVVGPVQKYINHHTTTSIERSVLRMMGVNGAIDEMPFANLVVDRSSKDLLRFGISLPFGKALVKTKLTPNALAEKISKDEINLKDYDNVPVDQAIAVAKHYAKNGIEFIDENKKYRKKVVNYYDDGKRPLKYLIVATGNIHDDSAQAVSAAEEGADIIAVIRHTAQSLLDYVPDGLTTEGFGGTYATQANFELMRNSLDKIGKKLSRYIRLVNYSSGLCMSEIAVLAAFERLDVLLNDSMYGILFRDINMKRTFVDQYFSRLICARSEITINTGEDNYLTTTDAYRNAHQVLASQFINEQFAFSANMNPALMGLGHAFEMDPKIEDGFLYELAQAEMIREIFPRAPIKYMPPTKHMTGDIMFGQVLDTMFNVVGAMTEQGIQLLGIPTEAIHNPHIQDRYWSLKNANYVFNNARHLGDEVSFNPNGKIARRAHTVLENTHKHLKRVERSGLMQSIEKGMFADMPRKESGGKGLEGVIQKDRRYFNPVLDILKDGAGNDKG